MKSFYLVLGAVAFCAGFALATGVDYNPVQAIYAVLLMGVSCVSLKRADAMQESESRKAERKVKSEEFATAHREAA